MSKPKKPDAIDLSPDDWQEVDPATGSSRDHSRAAQDALSSGALSADDNTDLERPDGLPQGYELLEDGLYWTSSSGEMKRIGSWLRVAVSFKEATGRGWGKVIELRDPEGQLQRLLVLNGEISGHWPHVQSDLQNLGFEPSVDQGAMRRLKDLVVSWKPSSTMQRSRRSGWVDGDDSAFILGDRIIGVDRFMTDLQSALTRDLEVKGTLTDWRETVGKRAAGPPPGCGPLAGLLRAGPTSARS
jgi:hypothetical protein